MLKFFFFFFFNLGVVFYTNTSLLTNTDAFFFFISYRFLNNSVELLEVCEQPDLSWYSSFFKDRGIMQSLRVCRKLCADASVFNCGVSCFGVLWVAFFCKLCCCTWIVIFTDFWWFFFFLLFFFFFEVVSWSNPRLVKRCAHDIPFRWALIGFYSTGRGWM